ncbi:MAG: carbohydrate ABC transporter substrate-binding protein, partial [Pygmaiobacter sp.]
ADVLISLMTSSALCTHVLHCACLSRVKQLWRLSFDRAHIKTILLCSHYKETTMNRVTPLSWFFAALLAAAALTGCGKRPVTEPVSSLPTAVQVLEVAAIETIYGTQPWEAVCLAFEREHPGVVIDLVMEPNLEDALSERIQAGDFPDVVQLNRTDTDSLTAILLRENALEDLTDVLSMEIPGEAVSVRAKLIDGFADTPFTMPKEDGKTYLTPLFFSPYGLFYNAELFRDEGWQLPATWEEMWALGDKAATNGIALFCYPTTGYLDALVYALLYEAGGPDFFRRATHYEEGIWETPEAARVLEVLSSFAAYTDTTVPAHANNDDFLINQQLLLENRALFLPCGIWLPYEMRNFSRAEGFQWGFTALPALEEGGAAYSYAACEQCWIPKEAQHKALAKEFIAFLYSDEAAGLFAEVGAAVPIRGIETLLLEEDELFFSIYQHGAKAAMGTFTIPDPAPWIPTIPSVWFYPIDRLVTGELSPQNWMNDIVAANDSLREAQDKSFALWN